MPKKQDLKHGDVWEQPIAEILEGWFSVDQAKPGAWDSILDEKRSDEHYPQVVESIRKHGFTVPVTCIPEVELSLWTIPPGYTPREDALSFGDGHHRLAAAIDLGMTTVPIRYHSRWSHGPNGACRDDSGDWSGGRVPRRSRSLSKDKEAISA